MSFLVFARERARQGLCRRERGRRRGNGRAVTGRNWIFFDNAGSVALVVPFDYPPKSLVIPRSLGRISGRLQPPATPPLRPGSAVVHPHSRRPGGAYPVRPLENLYRWGYRARGAVLVIALYHYNSYSGIPGRQRTAHSTYYIRSEWGSVIPSYQDISDGIRFVDTQQTAVLRPRCSVSSSFGLVDAHIEEGGMERLMWIWEGGRGMYLRLTAPCGHLSMG